MSAAARRAASIVMMIAASGGAQCAPDGAQIFQQSCAQCHGPNADGRGPLSGRFNPPPSNLAASKRTDDYKTQIITLGGAALGRSEVMPQWGLELSGEEILAIVGYLRKVAEEHERTAGKGESPRSSSAMNTHG